MNDREFKTTEIKINNLVNLRTTYYSIVIVLTGGVIGLFYNINFLNIILLFVGIILDYLSILTIINITQRINKLFQLLEENK